MNNSKLIRGLAALAVCALFLPMEVTAKDQVERPFKLRSDFTTVNYTPFPSVAVLEGTGWATHLGSVTSKGELVGYVAPGVALFRGTFTSANGDEVFWDAYVTPGSATPCILRAAPVGSRTPAEGATRYTPTV